MNGKEQLYRLATTLISPESDNDADALIEAFGNVEANRMEAGGELLGLLEMDFVYGANADTYTAGEMRAHIRAIMRGDLEPSDCWSWWPADLIREITEWHDAGRPQVAKGDSIDALLNDPA